VITTQEDVGSTIREEHISVLQATVLKVTTFDDKHRNVTTPQHHDERLVEFKEKTDTADSQGVRLKTAAVAQRLEPSLTGKQSAFTEWRLSAR